MLALLAVLALLANPVAAAAAQVACTAQENASAMSGLDMAGMPGMAHESADPCCDHSGKSKTADLTCVQACAAACAVILAMPSPAVSVVRPTSMAPRASQAPARLERPPRSIS